jgi:hypothetical protein
MGMNEKYIWWIVTLHFLNIKETGLDSFSVEDCKSCNHTEKYTVDRKNKRHRQVPLHFKQSLGFHCIRENIKTMTSVRLVQS